MRRLGYVVAAIGLISSACVSTESTGGDAVAVPADAQALIDAAVDALNEIDSYRASYSIPQPEDARGDAAWEIQYDAPDSYRFTLPWADGPTVRQCESYTLPEGGSGETCREVVTEVTESGVREAIYVGDSAYGRECEDVDEGCGDWERQPRPDVPFFGPSPSYLPGWPAVVLEMMAVDGEPQIEEHSIVRVVGTVNLLRAVLENSRRFAEAAGVTTFGEECETQATPGGGAGEEICRELTFEEMLEREDDVPFEDENPSEVIVWISQDGLPPWRIEITQAPRPGETETSAMVIVFSDFNEIEIEAPE